MADSIRVRLGVEVIPSFELEAKNKMCILIKIDIYSLILEKDTTIDQSYPESRRWKVNWIKNFLDLLHIVVIAVS